MPLSPGIIYQEIYVNAASKTVCAVGIAPLAKSVKTHFTGIITGYVFQTAKFLTFIMSPSKIHCIATGAISTWNFA